MVRHLVLGNGNILVCMDRHAYIRDFYFPHVGLENHTQGHRHLIGVWVDGKFSWLHDNGWKIDIGYLKDTLVGDIRAVNDNLKIELRILNTVHHEKNIYIKEVAIRNLGDKQREVRVFLNQHFQISESTIGDTVYYDPFEKAIVHYKGCRYFFVCGQKAGYKPGIDDYATGVADSPGREGTYIDAEDGMLSKNAIEHGSVDSTVSFNFMMNGNGQKKFYYWITCGKNISESHVLNKFVLDKKPDNIIKHTARYWEKWVNRKGADFRGLDSDIVDFFKRSLLIIRTQIDNGGAIIAANDSDTLWLKRDTYSYMWPRDGALVARALDKAGHSSLTRRFFDFFEDVLSPHGYLMHKYRADKSIGSSWHPWIRDGKVQLPIQEDETALCIYALWKHYEDTGDKKFVKAFFKKTCIFPAGEFMLNYIDKKTGLPKESYDLWEEIWGVHTFTCCAVYAGLVAASNLAKLKNCVKEATKYRIGAEKLRAAIVRELYDADEKRFVRGLVRDKDGRFVKDKTVDCSSGYGVFEFNVLDVDDPRVASTMEVMEDRLRCRTPIGGIARYENDMYHKKSPDVPGNPWFVATLWLAEYYITKAKSKDDLKPALEIIHWTMDHSLPSGIISEQIHPMTGEPVSVAPLTWSHSAFIVVILKYLAKLAKFRK